MGRVVLTVSKYPEDDCQSIWRSQKFKSAEFSKVVQECRKLRKLNSKVVSGGGGLRRSLECSEMRGIKRVKPVSCLKAGKFGDILEE